MSKRVVLMTGASSCTGAHIAHELGSQGFEVVSLLTRDPAAYKPPLLRQRLEHARPKTCVYHAGFGSDAMLAAIHDHKPAVYINHGSSLKNYRSPDFDRKGCHETNTFKSEEVFRALKSEGCQKIIHSGTFFESDGTQKAISVYAETKSDIWESIREVALGAGLATTKVWIPNAVGPLENVDRLIPSMVALWKSGETPTMKAPFLIRDNMPANWLARVYANEAKAAPMRAENHLRPSGFVMSNVGFITMLLEKLLRKRDHRFKLMLDPQPFTEQLEKFNQDRCPELDDPRKIDEFFDQWFRALELI